MRPEAIVAATPWPWPVWVNSERGSVDQFVRDFVGERLPNTPMLLVSTPWPFGSQTIVFGMGPHSDPWFDLLQLTSAAGRELRFSDEGILVMT